MTTPFLNNPVLMLAFQLGITFLAFLAANWLLNLFARKTLRRLEKEIHTAERLARLKTLTQVARSVIFIFILSIFILILLHAFGINITPLLTGAGIAGLALTLGTQTLVKDFLNGILILVEGQYSVGDIVQVGAFTGEVEKITLRCTSLRDLEGRLHILPNGEIRALSNLTTSWSRAVVDLNLPLETDFNSALAILEEAVQALNLDPEINIMLIDPPTVTGWTALKDGAVQVRLMAKTQPGNQYLVAAALRKTSVEALKKAGIETNMPRQVVELRPGKGMSSPD